MGRLKSGGYGRASRVAGAQRRFAAAAEQERGEVAAALRRAGADHVVLSTDGDWLKGLAGHLRRGEAALRAGNSTRAAVAARLQATHHTAS